MVTWHDIMYGGISHIDDLMEKRCTSIANTMELHLFYIKPFICALIMTTIMDMKHCLMGQLIPPIICHVSFGYWFVVMVGLKNSRFLFNSDILLLVVIIEFIWLTEMFHKQCYQLTSHHSMKTRDNGIDWSFNYWLINQSFSWLPIFVCMNQI